MTTTAVTTLIRNSVLAERAAEAAGPVVEAGMAVTITRPSMIDGRPFTRTVYLVRTWKNLSDPLNQSGQAWIVTNQPGHAVEMHEVLTAAERATAR